MSGDARPQAPPTACLRICRLRQQRKLTRYLHACSIHSLPNSVPQLGKQRPAKGHPYRADNRDLAAPDCSERNSG
jgi:hypothetical protein